MNIFKKAAKSYFNWWTSHFYSNYDVFTPTGMIPYRFIESAYMNDKKKTNK